VHNSRKRRCASMARWLLAMTLSLAALGCNGPKAKFDACLERGPTRSGAGELVACVCELRGIVVYEKDSATIFPGARFSCLTPDGRKSVVEHWTGGNTIPLEDLLPPEIYRQRHAKDEADLRFSHDRRDRLIDFSKPRSPRPIPTPEPAKAPVSGVRIVGWSEVEYSRKEKETSVRFIRKPLDVSSNEGLSEWEHDGMKFWVIGASDVPPGLWALGDKKEFVQCVDTLARRDKRVKLDLGTIGFELEIAKGAVVAARWIEQSTGTNPPGCVNESLLGVHPGPGLKDGPIQIFVMWWR